MKTRYDEIKEMNVDELAEFIYSAADEICFENCTRETGNKYSCNLGDKVTQETCIKCMKNYLESEVTE